MILTICHKKGSLGNDIPSNNYFKSIPFKVAPFSKIPQPFPNINAIHTNQNDTKMIKILWSIPWRQQAQYHFHPDWNPHQTSLSLLALNNVMCVSALEAISVYHNVYHSVYYMTDDDYIRYLYLGFILQASNIS